jgi:hypothetical protein
VSKFVQFSNNKSSQEMKDNLKNCVKLAQTTVIQGSSLNVLYDVFRLAAINQIIKIEGTVNDLLSNISKDSLNCVAKSVSTLVL